MIRVDLGVEVPGWSEVRVSEGEVRLIRSRPETRADLVRRESEAALLFRQLADGLGDLPA